MSDDRMDRAERIRNMREGNRSTDDETADDGTTTAESTGGTDSTADPASGDTSTERASAERESPTTTSTETRTTNSGAERSGTTTTSAAATSTSEANTPATETQTSVATGTESAADDGAATEADDATAAAQRAAASAAEVMGEGSVTAETEAADSDPTAGNAPAGGAAGPAGQVPEGVELPDQQLLEEAMSNSTVQSTEGGARAAAVEGGTSKSEELVRVLEFSLGDEYYCLDIEYVEEIVKRSAVTRVPNTPEFVDGVVDLRGQITTILEPKEMMDIEAEGDQNLIIVFDPEQFEEQGAVGWVVDEVRQVVPVTEDEVNSPPVDADYINGVVDREEYDQFVIWVEPDDALEQATSTEED